MSDVPIPLSHRRFLKLTAFASAAGFLGGCGGPDRPTARPTAGVPLDSAVSSGPPSRGQPAPPVATRQRTLYRDAALTDAHSDRLQFGVSVFVMNGQIA